MMRLLAEYAVSYERILVTLVENMFCFLQMKAAV